MTPVVVSWIQIQTRSTCGHVDQRDRGSVRCGRFAEWEEVRATDGTPASLDVGKPRLRCEGHFPADSAEVIHIKEVW